ncbi:MAG TPA: hypothetical protein VFL47_15610, partial [Flavisolibacter sp.]|nr:hypothetical protein [Flavisolibacter sp.]
MKKNVPSTRCMLLLTATLLCFFSLFTSCQKSGEKETDPAPAPTNRDISLLTTSAVPGELVLAQANFTPENDTATILVGTKTVVAVKVDSNRIAFVMPVLPANSTASIRYDKMGLTKQVSITINDYIPITQPDDVYNQLMTELDKTQQLFAGYENDTIIQLDAQYRQILDYVKQRFAVQYTSMTNAQRLEVAYGIRSNMINAQDFKVETQNVLFVARTQGDPGDPGDICRTVIGRILGTSGSAYIKMLRGGALTATGAAMIALGDPITKAAGVVTAGLGVALFIRGANEYIQAHSYDNVLNEMLGVRQAGLESLRTADNPIELLNNTETAVLFKGLFRTINQADAGSSN